MKPFKFRCTYCDKRYKRESAFEAHHCKEKERSEFMTTLHGQKAYSLYKKWISEKGHRNPTEKSFIESNVYNQFVNMVSFVKKVGMPDVDLYIKLMVKNTLPPSQWMNDIAYSHYINHLDRRTNANEQALMTVDTVFDYCETNEIDLEEFFDHIQPTVFLKFIFQRRLSPWILLHSKKFKTFYKNKLSIEQKKIFENIHDPNEWKDKLIKNKPTCKNMEKVVRELLI